MISPAVAEETEMLSEEVPAAITDPALALTAAAAPRAWDLEGEAEVVARAAVARGVVEAGDADSR